MRITDKTVITLGKFEALHLGHVQLISATLEYARLNDLASALLSFVPHPAQILGGAPEDGYKPLFTEREKGLLLELYGLDHCISYPFDVALSRLSPLAFCGLLREQFNCVALIVGENFRFGYGREGTPWMDLGVEVITVPMLQEISTSQIRRFLSEGKIKEAKALMGRAFFIMGEVQRGRQLGRSIGFPTANIHPAADKFLPPKGVYASRVTLGSKTYSAVTNIGTNPTVADELDHKVETHIFNFDRDIYGLEISVEILEFIRPERAFSSLDELRLQIAVDAGAAVKVLR